ncbi:MAG: RNB domain-containing ribonuclease [Desulfobacterales bacterium]|nr:RNB domain-containing ribonuclease [Desulfobacterales bacterium]
MEKGNIIEFIDNQRILCAVIMEIKKQQRIRILTEEAKEVILPANRIAHKSNNHNINISIGLNKIVESIKQRVSAREHLKKEIDIKELWDVLYTENEWVDINTMTSLCFSKNINGDHESAVLRAFFDNKLYFKFSQDKFLPYSEIQVERNIAQIKEAEKRQALINDGIEWVKKGINDDSINIIGDRSYFVNILKSYFLFDKESKHFTIAKAIASGAKIDTPDILFNFLVKIGAWDKNENIELLRHNVPIEFPKNVLEKANESSLSLKKISLDNDSNKRKDFTYLPIITIDGQSTLDYDDALSLEKIGNLYQVGIHIADVGYIIKKGDFIDEEAFTRASSIYMPDKKISMLPHILSEDSCSLKAEEIRPAISIMATMNQFADILNYEIVPSFIKVKRQLSYSHVATILDQDEELKMLFVLAQNFRQKRLDNGAVLINLPEINIWIGDDGDIVLKRSEKENHARILVSEMMILANWLMAKFIAENKIPAVFRSQGEPSARLYKKNEEGSLFQNWMQRKHLNRFVLGTHPEHHSGLGLGAYVTATSPIRRYYDLITQRQIKAILGLEEPYSKEEVRMAMLSLEQPMRLISKIQILSYRYWLLKYLEKEIGTKEEAIVLEKQKNQHWVLIPKYMIECQIPSSGLDLKPKDIVQITIQNVNARKDILSVFV